MGGVCGNHRWQKPSWRLESPPSFLLQFLCYVMQGIEYIEAGVKTVRKRVYKVLQMGTFKDDEERIQSFHSRLLLEGDLGMALAEIRRPL